MGVDALEEGLGRGDAVAELVVDGRDGREGGGGGGGREGQGDGRRESGAKRGIHWMNLPSGGV